MSSKLAKKLKRDLKKSPGKAAALALLAGVAVWFWAPLVKGFFGHPTPAVATATASKTNAAEPTPSSVSKPNTQPQYTWKQIVEAAAHDSRRKPVPELPGTRDPFREVKSAKVEEEPKTQEAPPAPIAVDVPPESAGIVLMSTILGNRMQVARINGKSYHLGDMVPAATADATFEYQLIGIRGRSVILSRDHKQYELKMTQPRSSAAGSTVGVSSETSDFDPSMFPEE